MASSGETNRERDRIPHPYEQGKSKPSKEDLAKGLGQIAVNGPNQDKNKK